MAAVARGGKIVFARGYGLADRQRDRQPHIRVYLDAIEDLLFSR